MRNTFTLLFLLMFHFTTPAQQFIKTFADASYGAALRILPTNDNGWVIFAIDNLNLTKFNNCGIAEWSRNYNIPNTVGLNDFIRTSDGGFALLTRIQLANTFAALVTKIDTQGNIIWSKSYEDPTNDYSEYPYSINEDQQGNLIVFCNAEFHIASNPGFLMVLKISNNGTIVSNRFYDQGGTWGGAIVTSDNGVLIRTGSSLIKTANNGNVQWSTTFLGSNYYLAPVEVSDGYILTGQNNNQVVFYKFDLNGQPLWGDNFKESNLFDTPPVFVKKNNGNIVAVVANSVVEFDKELNVIHQATIDRGLGLIARKLCFLNYGTPVITGLRSGSFDLFFAKLKPLYQTNCDTVSLPIITTTSILNIFPSAYVFSNYNLATTNHSFTADTFSIPVSLICPPSLELGNDTLICHQLPIVLKNRFIEQFESFNWSTGETTESIAVTSTGKYWLTVSFNCGSVIYSDTINVTFVTPISNNLGSDAFECVDEFHTYTAPACSVCSYLWNNGITGDTIVVSDPGNYWLNVTDSVGCIYSDTVALFNSKCECQLYFPNSFTPNNDGLNEAFQPYYYCDISDYQLKVFNRWGEQVFSADNPTLSWDGRHQRKAVPTGIYYFVATYTPILKGKVDKPIAQTGSLMIFY